MNHDDFSQYNYDTDTIMLCGLAIAVFMVILFLAAYGKDICLV